MNYQYADLQVGEEQHIVEYGVTVFIVINDGNFDRLAVKVVTEARNTSRSNLDFVVVVPPSRTDYPNTSGFYYPPSMEGIPCRVAIVSANGI